MMRRNEKNINKYVLEFLEVSGKKNVNQENKLVSIGKNRNWTSQAELDIAQDNNEFFKHLEKDMRQKKLRSSCLVFCINVESKGT